MMALPNIDINAGTPPLLWSNVQEAFEKINENFTALDLATGGTAVDLSNLFTDIKPSSTQTYQLGDQLHRWKSVHTGTWSEVPGSELNGLWAGASQIKGYQDSSLRNIIELPEGSTVAGNLIIDPDKTFFKAAQVDSDLRVEADEFSDTINLNSGTAIQLVVDSSSESITFNNTGVTSAVAGLGISVSSATGAVTVTNTGVRSLQSVTALPAGRSTGAGINISGSSGDNLRITNTGVLEVQQGFGITVSTDVATGVATVSFNTAAAPQTAFTTIAIQGDNPANNIQSDTTSDTFTFEQGYGIILTNNPTTDTMTVAVNNRIDIVGSVFADNSTLLVDAVSNYIYGNVSATTLRTEETVIALGSSAGLSGQGTNGIAIGALAGQTNQGVQSVAIGASSGNSNQGLQSVALGNLAGALNQGQRAVAIGSLAGSNGQGDYAVALGNFAGGTNQPANSIVINASGVALNGSAAGLFVDPIRNQSGASGVVQYDSTTKEVSYSSALGSVSGTFTGNIFTNLIDSADSSQIVVTPLMRFSSDVVVENEVFVRGSKIILLNDLKSVVAASSSFADFQARIAALV